MKASFSRRMLLYLLLGAAASLLMAGGSLLDGALGMSGGLSLLVRVALVVAALFVLRRADRQEVPVGSVGSPWLLLALIPVLFQVVMCFGPLDHVPEPLAAAFGILGVGLTALWEELLFRGLALTLFAKDGRLSWAAALGTSAVFGVCHLVNLIGTADPLARLGDGAVQAIFAALCGLFFLGLTLRARSLFAAVIAHLFLDGVLWFFEAFSTASGRYASDAILVVQMLALLALGVWTLWKPCARE